MSYRDHGGGAPPRTGDLVRIDHGVRTMAWGSPEAVTRIEPDRLLLFLGPPKTLATGRTVGTVFTADTLEILSVIYHRLEVLS